MIGQMMNYNVSDKIEKDKVARDFIREVNPYQFKRSLGIDLRALSHYAARKKVNIIDMDKSEIEQFKIQNSKSSQ